MGNVASSSFGLSGYLTSYYDHDILAALTKGHPESLAVTAPVEGKESGIYQSYASRDLDIDGINAKYYGRGPAAVAADSGSSRASVPAEASLAESMKRTCREHSAKNAMAWRETVRVEKTEIEVAGKKKPWEFLHLGPVQYITYAAIWEAMQCFGAGLKALTGCEAGAQIGLYEETRKEWMISCYGLWLQSYVGVTVYANLGEDALLYAFKEAELGVIVCNGKAVSRVARLCQDAGAPIPTMIYLDEIPANAETHGAVVYRWADVVAKGKEVLADATSSASAGVTAERFPTSSDDTALIMYTSGTTGDPKGVVLSHGNIYAAVNSFNEVLVAHIGDEKELTYVAFLPLAHILEFAAENVFLLHGALVCFGGPRTLSSTSAKPRGDLEEYKPVAVLGVPRIFETIKKAIEAKLPSSGVKRAIFDRAYRDRVEGFKKGLRYPAYDSTVFAIPRQMFGGRCRVIGSGGAAISPETQEFMSVVLNCYCGQGYGLTETCAQTSLVAPWDLGKGSSGALLSSVQVKLVDVEHWKHTDTPHPRGEIYVRGPNVAKGYYKQPQKTAEAYTEDGWFKTGDIGSMDETGRLRIIGRVKALAKNLMGEYIAIETLESIYVLNDLAVPNGVCVVVHPQRAYIAAIVATDEAKAMKFAKANGIENAEWPAVLDSAEFRKKAAESFAKTAKDRQRLGFELVKEVRVVADEWTPENGIMTAAMKIKRHEVDKQYATVIEELFKNQ